METTDQASRNYSTISPSAKSLLLMKGYTNIPFARRAAELITYPELYIPDYDNKDLGFCLMTAHFESRYLSIDQLLSDLAVKNILELSSGFSFRGLAAAMQKDIHYIDTDLEEIIEKKKELIGELQSEPLDLKAKLELLPLNALDEKQFSDTISHFPEGEVVIVNEGLLVYLDTEEKERLCSIIHKILKQRGGYWITADIYIKNISPVNRIKIDDDLRQLFEQHRIEENKFDSLEAAEEFFKKCGFTIDKEALIDYSKLDVIPHVLKKATPEQLQEMGKSGKTHTTWRLKVTEDSGSPIVKGDHLGATTRLANGFNPA